MSTAPPGGAPGPLALLAEAVGLRVLVEALDGTRYFGTVAEAGPDFDLVLTAARRTCPGQAADRLERVAIRGSAVRWVSLPPELEFSLARRAAPQPRGLQDDGDLL